MSDPHNYDHSHGDHLSDTESEHDLSRRMQERQHRPASIDMALNLERELEEHEHDDHGVGHGGDLLRSSTSTDPEARRSQENPSSPRDPADGNRRVSLDPQVLQHIITNLRDELAKAQEERNELAEKLANSPTREAELREALKVLTEESAATDAELDKLRRKSQEDDESIQMLRTKLEESRRALMRLQTENRENKRMSMSHMNHMNHMSVDISRANSLFGGGPTNSKRASFTPLTGSGLSTATQSRMNYSHRRISSVSDSDVIDMSSEPMMSPPAAGHAISWPQENDANAKKNRRSSAFFGGVPVSMGLGLARSRTPSPPQQQSQLASETSSIAEQNHSIQKVEALRKERDTVRAELADARKELVEAQEARQASEQCVIALREFIAAQAANDATFGNGNGILKLPPLPTEKDVDESIASQGAASKKTRPAAGASGWSFGKLFRSESGGSSDSSAISPPTLSDSKPSNGTNDTSSHSSSPSTATPAGAFSRTFGGLFRARTGSIASIGSVTSSPTNAKEKKMPPRPPAAHGQQEPTLNGMGSDDEDGDYPGASTSVNNSLESRSSTTGPPEPSSPRASTGHESRDIWIRDGSSSLEPGLGERDGDRISLSSTRALAPNDDDNKFDDETASVLVQSVGAPA